MNNLIAGDVDRLRRFWLTGVCKPHKQKRQFSEPLATEQFLSTFLLLLAGIGLAILFLGLEYTYYTYIRPRLNMSEKKGACCSLISVASSLLSTLTRSINYSCFSIISIELFDFIILIHIIFNST